MTMLLLRHTSARLRLWWRGGCEIARQAVWERQSFSTLQAAGSEPLPLAPSGHVRWINQVDVGGTVKPGLFMHPTSSQTFKIRVHRRGRIRASIALLPQVWDKNRGGVLFSISTTSVGTRAHVHKEWAVSPRENPNDRCWKTVELILPRSPGREVEVRFATTLPDGAPPDYAWAIWGDPELRSRRPLGAFLRRQIESIHSRGVRSSLRRYQALITAAGASDKRYALWFMRSMSVDIDPKRLRQEAAKFGYQPKISLITPVFNVEPQWLCACIESVRHQVYQNWELCLCDDGSSRAATIQVLAKFRKVDDRIRVTRLETNRGISAASNQALSLATGEFVGLLDHDDELTPDALYEVVKYLNTHPDLDLIYSDEDKLETDGSPTDPYFKPDWSPEYLRSVMYIGHFAVYRRSLVDAVGQFRSEFDGSQDYDLALRITERTSRIAHIPRVLYHWRKAPSSAAGSSEAKLWGHAAGLKALVDHVASVGLAAEVLDHPGRGFRRVRYRILNDPLVTIVIPTNGHIAETADGPRDLPLNCLRSIVERTSYERYELLVVDNGWVSPATQSYLDGTKHRRVSFPDAEPFNLAAKINFSAGHARGEHLLLLHDDVEVIGGDWLEAMLEFSQQAEIGAVGAKLFYPDGRIQHIGVALGIQGAAAHIFRGQPKDHPGYFGSAWVVRNYSAVTGACLMTRRAVFNEVGGFDERFPVHFGDIDYCLRVGAKRYRIVFTPFAQLYHIDEAMPGNQAHTASVDEVQVLSRRWQPKIDADPFYNPNLTRSSLNCGLRVE